MLRKKRIQNKIAASRFSLPVTATLAALVWVAVGFMQYNIWVEFAFTIISTFLMVELNNRNSLMRTYSRMVSCSFLMLITMAFLPDPSLKSCIVTMCIIVYYLIIWNGYQDRASTGWTFYAFTCIGLASMVFVQIGYYLPFLWLIMLTCSNNFSLRTFFASILGIITPYWFAAGYYAYTDTLDDLLNHFIEFINYKELFDYSQVTVHEVVNLIFLVILGIIGTIHFLHTSYADKIRTRMIYDSFILMDVLSLIFIILQPQHGKELGGIMIVNTAPLIAHFSTFTKGKITNIMFITILVAMALILLFNLFLPDVLLLQ